MSVFKHKGWPRSHRIRPTFSPSCATLTYDMDSMHQDLFGISSIDDSTFETQNTPTPSTCVDSLGSPCVHCLELGRRCPRCRLKLLTHGYQETPEYPQLEVDCRRSDDISHNAKKEGIHPRLGLTRVNLPADQSREEHDRFTEEDSQSRMAKELQYGRDMSFHCSQCTTQLGSKYSQPGHLPGELQYAREMRQHCEDCDGGNSRDEPQYGRGIRLQYEGCRCDCLRTKPQCGGEMRSVCSHAAEVQVANAVAVIVVAQGRSLNTGEKYDRAASHIRTADTPNATTRRKNHNTCSKCGCARPEGYSSIINRSFGKGVWMPSPCPTSTETGAVEEFCA